MSLPDKSIDPKILNSAKIEFMSKGYADASLRTICQKAGVTTGALYKRFTGKEELFEALIKPTLQDIEEFVSRTENYDYRQLDQNQMQTVWDMSVETLKSIVEFCYEHYDGFKLLLCHADGSIYSDFLNDFVTDHTKRTIAFMDTAYQKGISQNHINEDEIHMALTAFWSTLFEPIKHDLPKAKALQYCEIVAKLFNWQAIFGF
jgi:AcrR family transcriptional regulator